VVHDDVTMTVVSMMTLFVAVPTGLEPATSGLTGRRALQTAPRDQGLLSTEPKLRGRPPYQLDADSPNRY
jgi:hypothetical protein